MEMSSCTLWKKAVGILAKWIRKPLKTPKLPLYSDRWTNPWSTCSCSPFQDLLLLSNFRDGAGEGEGKDVLFFVDNIFRFTQAGSEVSALLGRMPSAVGYQPTLATEMGAMQERITSTKKGLLLPYKRYTYQRMTLLTLLLLLPLLTLMPLRYSPVKSPNWVSTPQ